MTPSPSPSPGSVPPAAPAASDESAARSDPVDSLILHATDNGVSWLTLNRPDAMNAVTWDQRERLIDLLAEASADPGVRAVVLTATGKGFCAGADLRGSPAGRGAGRRGCRPDDPRRRAAAHHGGAGLRKAGHRRRQRHRGRARRPSRARLRSGAGRRIGPLHRGVRPPRPGPGRRRRLPPAAADRPTARQGAAVLRGRPTGRRSGTAGSGQPGGAGRRAGEDGPGVGRAAGGQAPPAHWL